MQLEDLLRIMVRQGASDLFICAEVPPSLKCHGKVVALSRTPLTAARSRTAVLGLMNEAQRREFLATRECNFAISVAGLGRFRVSAYHQRQAMSMVLRRIETEIPTIEALGLPAVVRELAMARHGIVLVVGGSGNGKSTTLAAMVGHRNAHGSGHIVTIEDPIEFLHRSAGCIVSQREVGIDTDSFEVALKNTLRQAPDVILIGEIRSREVMDHALAFAETGHLVLATLHATNANQALERIVHFFPAERQAQLYLELSFNLRGILAQQLVPAADGQGRHACIEVLLNTPLVRDHIRKGELHRLKELMQKSQPLGMQTLDQGLFELCRGGRITPEEALRHADSPNDLRLLLKLGELAGSCRLHDATREVSVQQTAWSRAGRLRTS